METSRLIRLALDAARRPKFNKNTDHWVSTETGSHLLIRGDKVIAGADGIFNGSQSTSKTLLTKNQPSTSKQKKSSVAGTLNGHSVKDAIKDLESHYRTSKDVWNASMEDVQKLSQNDYDKLSDELENSNYHAENALLKTKRLGNKLAVSSTKCK